MHFDWVTLAQARLRSLKPDAIGRDVLPFLERPPDADLLTREHLLALLESMRGAGADRR